VEPGYSDLLIALLEKAQNGLQKKGQGEARVGSPAGSPPQPGVLLTWPLPCASVDRPIDLTAIASEGSRAVQRVEFFADGVVLGAATTPPYRVRFDPSGMGDRAIELEARALGKSGTAASFKSTVRLNKSNDACKIGAH
jgi:hypothetical protein